MKKNWIKVKKSEIKNAKNIFKKVLNIHKSNDSENRRKSYEEIILAEAEDKTRAIQNRNEIENNIFRCPFCDAIMKVYECKGENTCTNKRKQGNQYFFHIECDPFFCILRLLYHNFVNISSVVVQICPKCLCIYGFVNVFHW